MYKDVDSEHAGDANKGRKANILDEITQMRRARKPAEEC
jgi:hypothetical protein